MAIAAPQSKTMTYEDYLTEGEIEGRYEIIDGVRIFMTSPSRKHQRIAIHLTVALEAFERLNANVRLFIAPSDLLTSRKILRIRQPDLYLISLNRLGVDADDATGVPLGIPPELAIEILSPTDSRSTIEPKLLDYAHFGINECWLVSPESATVQVFTLANGEYHSAQIYGDHETLRSIVFPSMEIALDDIFAD